MTICVGVFRVMQNVSQSNGNNSVTLRLFHQPVTWCWEKTKNRDCKHSLSLSCHLMPVCLAWVINDQNLTTTRVFCSILWGLNLIIIWSNNNNHKIVLPKVKKDLWATVLWFEEVQISRMRQSDGTRAFYIDTMMKLHDWSHPPSIWVVAAMRVIINHEEPPSLRLLLCTECEGDNSRLSTAADEVFCAGIWLTTPS